MYLHVPWPGLSQEYFQNHHGDWLAVDFKAKKERDELSQHFRVEGIPSILADRDGDHMGIIWGSYGDHMRIIWDGGAVFQHVETKDWKATEHDHGTMCTLQDSSRNGPFLEMSEGFRRSQGGSDAFTGCPGCTWAPSEV